jgi:hypothetical protein
MSGYISPDPVSDPTSADHAAAIAHLAEIGHFNTPATPDPTSADHASAISHLTDIGHFDNQVFGHGIYQIRTFHRLHR